MHSCFFHSFTMADVEVFSETDVFKVFCEELVRLDKEARMYVAKSRDSEAVTCTLTKATRKLQTSREATRSRALGMLKRVCDDFRFKQASQEVERLNEIYRHKLSISDRHRAIEARRRTAEERRHSVSHEPVIVVSRVSQIINLCDNEQVPSAAFQSEEDFCFCASLISDGNNIQTCNCCAKSMHSKCLLRTFEQKNDIRCPYCRHEMLDAFL